MSAFQCDDCGRSNWDAVKRREVEGFGSVIANDGASRLYCGECRKRRGLTYQFDPRPWSLIEASLRKVAS